MSYKFNSRITDSNVHAFIIGLVSTLPYLFPSLISLRANPSFELYNLANLENKLLYLPVCFGLLHIFLFNIFNKIFTSQSRTYWLFGIIIGLIWASVDYYNNYYQDMYGFKNYFTIYIFWQIISFGFYGIFINYMFSNIK